MEKTALNKAWYTMAASVVTELLESNVEQGLSLTEVEKRQTQFGLNRLPSKKRISWLKLLLRQFSNPLVYILLVAGLVMLLVGHWTDTIVILAAVTINALFGFWQEYKTLNILDKLKGILVTKATVLRYGQKLEIDQAELVPGDMVFLQPGDKVPADGRLIESNNLSVSEAVLTGEWLAIDKHIKSLHQKDTMLGDRKNMVYTGSLVEAGTGMFIVTATGIHTETGKIAQLLEETETELSPLQTKLRHFAKTIGLLIGSLSLAIFVGGYLREGNLLEMFETSVAIAVGGIPEALPIVMTIILAIGMDRLLKKKGLIQKLSSVEILGSTSIICFDKTKTLTQGKMRLKTIVAEDKKLAAQVAMLTSDAYVENPRDSKSDWRLKGSPTDQVLLTAGQDFGLDIISLNKSHWEVAKLPFDSIYKFQASLRQVKRQRYIFVAGAPERLLPKSAEAKKWQKDINALASQGLRVVAVAIKKVSNRQDTLSVEDINNLEFIGLLAFEDRLRKGIAQAIKTALQAGLQPIIITGDFPQTAKAVAKAAGITVTDKQIITGQELDKLSPKKLADRLETLIIYARTEPRHKIQIVTAWQDKGKVVAMVGDGVNDSPALKKANIGIALGSGTEVAKAAADLVLLNDSFSIIVRAIRQGRITVDNIRKAIAYVLADSFTSIILVGFSKLVFAWPLPILPVQILWNNIVEDTLPNIAYAFEPGEKGVMYRQPDPKNTPLLTKEMKVIIFFTGIVNQFLALLVFWWLWQRLGFDLRYVRTVVFGSVCVNTAFAVFAYKNLRQNIWHIKLFSNPWLTGSAIIVVLAYAAAIYVPFLQTLLQTVALDIFGWMVIVGVSLISLANIEATKLLFIVNHKTDD
ncbi:HAD-IC family P-type ATPase [Candidatus Beckwithbacteria bacterium]|nr:HAD-IC family P-type ATPase [Candidatus Beckwithbacteria bacterium]